MKSYKIILTFTLAVVGIGAAYALQSLSPYELKQEYMDLQTAKKKFGTKKFDSSQFRKGSSVERSEMAADLIETKSQFLNKDPGEIQAALGPNTGYFFSDHLPAYLLNEGWTKNENTWQIVFLLNLDGKIKDVRIHKNRCTAKQWASRGLPVPKE